MSRQVDVMAGPLSQEDRDYLEARGRRHLILINERQFPRVPDQPTSAPQGSDEDGDESWEEEVNELTVQELRDELGERGLSTSGNKAELQQRLIEAGPQD